MVIQIASTDKMNERQLARPVGARQHREVVALSKEAAQHDRRLSGLQIQLEHGTETGEVDEYGLAIATIRAVSGMLCHVCVDDHAMRGRIPEPQSLIRL